MIRPVGRYKQTTDFERVISCIGELRGAGQSFPVIADRLNREGFRPPNRAVRFGKDIVRRLVRKHMSCDRIHPGSPDAGLGRNEWFVIDLAAKLGLGKTTIHAWLRRGWIRYRRLPGYLGRCVCWADAGELERLGQLAQTPRGWWYPPPPAELTTPKPLPSESLVQGE